jgi:hypothetical protein
MRGTAVASVLYSLILFLTEYNKTHAILFLRNMEDDGM